MLEPGAVAAEAGASPWNQAFGSTWSRTDLPVAGYEAERTWMWGPKAITAGLQEPYVDAKTGARTVQYFDKARMEVGSDPDVPADSEWYVTSGLLAKELITGKLQVGGDIYERRPSPEIAVAGDAADANAPTYATFTDLLDAPPASDAQLITATLQREGPVQRDDRFAIYGVRTAYRVMVDGLDHQIASPFWEFMNSTGAVYIDGAVQNGRLFPDPFYATGLPITEAYWSSIELDGEPTDVLLQCFERRCLTYTPDNPAGWRVESANAGRHYYQWRYTGIEPAPAPWPPASPVIVLDPGHDSSSRGAMGVEYADTLRTALAARDALQSAGYVVHLTRYTNATVLYDDPDLMPANAGLMEFGYNEGYAHATKALQYEPDLFISLHYNGSENPAEAGTTIYYSPAGGPQNAELARLVRNELLAALLDQGYEPPYARAAEDAQIGKTYGGLATLGNVYRAPHDLVENRMAGIPAVLTESLYESNPTERQIILDDATHAAFGLALLRAVDQYFSRE